MSPRSEKVKDVSSPMSRPEIEKLADSIKALLDDPDVALTDPLRRRWEGALTATEAILGRSSSLVGELDPGLL